MNAKKDDRPEKIRAFILSHVAKNPKHIVTLTADTFKVTRVTAHRHVKTLLKQGKLQKTGTTNSTTYHLSSLSKKHLQFKLSKDLSESEIWIKNFAELKNDLKENIYKICQYGFTEMVNNAIDHSEGTIVDIEMNRPARKIQFKIFDNGIGIFKKIAKASNLSTERESVLQLTKGKYTTDPDRHSGEGIFFSSRAFDSFAIFANGILYMRDNNENDWYIESRSDKLKKGTIFEMEIDLDSNRELTEVFAEYTDPETFSFDKTHILVNLSKSDEDHFISRSQAKRVLSGLDSFKDIILDFKDVKVVGQAFVDEVFRVFKNSHPDVSIKWKNANPDVEFMIKRGKAWK